MEEEGCQRKRQTDRKNERERENSIKVKELEWRDKESKNEKRTVETEEGSQNERSRACEKERN